MSDNQGDASQFKRGERRERNGFNKPRILPMNGNQRANEQKADECIRRFLRSGETSEILPEMSRDLRKVLHDVAKSHGLVTKSYGKEPHRHIVISLRNTKLTRSTLTLTDPIVPVSSSFASLFQFNTQNPIRKSDVKHFLTEKPTKLYQPKSGSSRQRSAIPPKSKCPKAMRISKNKLPTTKYREQVLASIRKHQVVIISGGTGCGKTTQVPQFILEEAHEKKDPVRIMVTQPRRIAAMAISERVAKERGEPHGDTVGFQVRLESKQSDRTLLTYCTTGVLLRMLTADPVASGITHIIMDEIHEREINTDYLLIAIRQCLHKRPDLKVILMSATIEGSMQMFAKYFEKQKVDVIRIESRTFDVKIFWLDQILAMSGYEPPVARSFFVPLKFEISDWKEDIKEIKEQQKKQKIDESVLVQQQTNMMETDPIYAPPITVSEPAIRQWESGEYRTLEGDVIPGSVMDDFMRAVGHPDFRPMMIDFHPTVPKSQRPTEITSHGRIPPIVIPPPPLSPEPVQTPSSTKSGLGRLVDYDGFGFGEKQEMAQLLEKKFREELKNVLPDGPVYYHPHVNEKVESVDFEKLRLAEKYHLFYGDDFKNTINHHLVDHVIKYLADSPVFGSILVFLPGYDDIQEMMNRIDQWKHALKNIKDVLVIPLHSQMTCIDPGQVFRSVSVDTRKIILATNIAEASITIEDVIFVVDTGKVKEKSYNHEAKLSTLAVTPIARSNAQQRSGRAGRVTNGYCIRLFSESEYNEMLETQLAEMKRAAIYDVTLHAKLFAPHKTSISDFLSLAPEPPSEESIEQSMQFLEQIGAFYAPNKFKSGSNYEPDDEEKDPDLTDLGRLMARLPLDPQLSRMLIFGLALKCFTPIVNLVAMLANRDPFILTSLESREEQTRRKALVALSDFSDHLMLIRLCSAFVVKSAQQQHHFCRENYLNYSTMRMVVGTRRQLLQELARAKLISVPQERDLTTAFTDMAFNRHSDCWPMVQAAIAAGCYPSIGVSSADQRLKKIQTFNDRPASLHPSSMVKKQVLKMNKQAKLDARLEFVAFQELVQIPSDLSLSMKLITVIPSITALLFTGPIRMTEQDVEDYQIVHENEEKLENKERSAFDTSSITYELDAWYGVRTGRKTLTQFLRLRHQFMHFFLQGIHDPQQFGQNTSHLHVKMLKVARDLLRTEHLRNNFVAVEMPNYFLKEYEPHGKPNKPQKSQPSEKQVQQKTKKLKVKKMGEELKSGSFSKPPNAQHPGQKWHSVRPNSQSLTQPSNVVPPVIPNGNRFPSAANNCFQNQSGHGYVHQPQNMQYYNVPVSHYQNPQTGWAPCMQFPQLMQNIPTPPTVPSRQITPPAPPVAPSPELQQRDNSATRSSFFMGGFASRGNKSHMRSANRRGGGPNGFDKSDPRQ
ncbi:unnamed protein product [Caenorhabditis sp. 36 PRJEB53466]|nr:unnamed protein product [Caenorhabditis sp. 36 PRJEB53466]